MVRVIRFPLLLSSSWTAGRSQYTWLLLPLLRAGCRTGNNQDKTQVKRLLSGSYSWHISSREISGNSCQEQVWAGVEGLSQVSAEKHGLVHRHQKKKFTAAALTWKPLVAETRVGIHLSGLVTSQGRWRQGRFLLTEILQQKFFLWS